MNPGDEQEIHRLCELLAALDATLPSTSPFHEGLKKGALAIQASFIHGYRAWVENMYDALQDPNRELTVEQRAHLVSIGIDPDA